MSSMPRTVATALAIVSALSSTLAGVLFVGHQSLVGLGGAVIAPGKALALVLISWLVSVLPMLSFTSLALLFSVASRSGIVGVIGPALVALASQLVSLIGKGVWAHTLLPGSAFDGWHGLFTSHPFYGQLIVSLIVSVAWIAGPLTTAAPAQTPSRDPATGPASSTCSYPEPASPLSSRIRSPTTSASPPTVARKPKPHPLSLAARPSAPATGPRSSIRCSSSTDASTRSNGAFLD
jgi:hypothetical protein